MVREIISAVSVATVLAMGAGSAAVAQQQANPCAAKNPCAPKK